MDPPKDKFRVIDVFTNGWCLYLALNQGKKFLTEGYKDVDAVDAFFKGGVTGTSPDQAKDVNTKAHLLSKEVTESLKANAQGQYTQVLENIEAEIKSIGANAVGDATIEKEIVAFKAQELAEGREPSSEDIDNFKNKRKIELAGIVENQRKEKITSKEQYVEQLSTLLNPADVNQGPLLWPDANLIGDVLANVLQANIIVYQVHPSDPAKYMAANAVFPRFIGASPSASPYKETITILHNGVNHFLLLVPVSTEPEVKLQSSIEDLKKTIRMKSSTPGLAKKIEEMKSAAYWKGVSASAKRAMEVGKMRLKSGSYKDEVIVAGERVRINEEGFDPARHTDVVSFVQKYAYTLGNRDDINLAVALFSRMFGGASEFDENNPLPPCKEGDQRLLLTLLYNRNKGLKNEITISQAVSPDSIYLRQKIEHLQRLNIMIDDIEANINRDSEECIGEGAGAAAAELVNLDVQDEQLKDILRKVAVLILHANNPSVAYQKLDVPAKNLVDLAAIVTAEDANTYPETWVKEKGVGYPLRLKPLLEMSDSALQEEIKKFSDAELEGFAKTIWDGLDRAEPSELKTSWDTKKEEIQVLPTPQEKLTETFKWIQTMGEYFRMKSKRSEDDKKNAEAVYYKKQGELEAANAALVKKQEEVDAIYGGFKDAADNAATQDAATKAMEEKYKAEIGVLQGNVSDLTRQVETLNVILQQNTTDSTGAAEQAVQLNRTINQLTEEADRVAKENAELKEKAAAAAGAASNSEGAFVDEITRVAAAIQAGTQYTPSASLSNPVKDQFSTLFNNVQAFGRGPAATATAPTALAPSTQKCFLGLFIAYFLKKIFFGVMSEEEKKKREALFKQVDSFIDGAEADLRASYTAGELNAMNKETILQKMMSVAYDCLEAAESYHLHKVNMNGVRTIAEGYKLVKREEDLKPVTNEADWTKKMTLKNDIFYHIYKQFDKQFEGSGGAAAGQAFLGNIKSVTKDLFSGLLQSEPSIAFRPRFFTVGNVLIPQSPDLAKYPSFIYFNSVSAPRPDVKAGDYQVIDLDNNGNTVTKETPENWKAVLISKLGSNKLPFEGLFVFFIMVARRYLREVNKTDTTCPLPAVLKDGMAAVVAAGVPAGPGPTTAVVPPAVPVPSVPSPPPAATAPKLSSLEQQYDYALWQQGRASQFDYSKGYANPLWKGAKAATTAAAAATTTTIKNPMRPQPIPSVGLPNPMIVPPPPTSGLRQTTVKGAIQARKGGGELETPPADLVVATE